jgi:TolB-like protein/Flp pilus assembly protein TadD
MSSVTFFAELKRRNVYKVGVAYAVVGWVIAQIATQIFPFLEIPNWVVRLVIVLIAIGFPIALVIAWAFEATPEGIKRTEVADAKHEHSRGKTWIYVVIIGAAISVALFFFGRYTAGNNASAARTELSAKSIAVLPFDNLSRDPDNAFFAEGVQDEILTRLAKVADLKVIARTSTQKFRSAPENLPDIAKQLGVANILEGSVQKSNDQVRVNVQLINALTDAHLWAEIYDRKLTDLFAVESEIAKTIADTLQAKLTGSVLAAMADRPTENSAAHELTVQGRHFLGLRRGDNLARAVALFQQAIAEDPNYASAYGSLSETYVLLPRHTDARASDTFPLARAAALRAIELNPNLPEAHNALGKIAYDEDMNFAESEREFRLAIKLNPNYAGAHHWYSGGPLESAGRFEEAIAEGKLATALDPLSAVDMADLGRIYSSARRFAEAKAIFEKAIALDPDFAYSHWHFGEMLQASGDVNSAANEYAVALRVKDRPESIALSGQLAAKMGHPDEAKHALEQLDELSKHRHVSSYWRALLWLSLGDRDKAITFLEETHAQRDGYEIGVIKVDPMLDALRGNSRFEALVTRVVGPQQADTQ